MANGIGMTITIEKELRPCRVGNRKGLFHMWEQYEEVLSPPLMIGGHRGGQLTQVFGLVEFNDTRKIERVDPRKIIFLDNKFNDYTFYDAANDKNEKTRWFDDE